MPKINISEALLEKEEHDSVTCKTCTAPATEEFAPYCMSCGLYWQDCDNGLWDDKVTPSSGSVYADLGLPEPEHGAVHRDGDNTYVWDGRLQVWVQTRYAEDVR